MIHEFSTDGVQYLELRSTPRGNSSTGMTKRSYVAAVLQGVFLALINRKGVRDICILNCGYICTSIFCISNVCVRAVQIF